MRLLIQAETLSDGSVRVHGEVEARAGETFTIDRTALPPYQDGEGERVDVAKIAIWHALTNIAREDIGLKRQ